MYNDCYKYGINSGCDINCPVLRDGECPEPGENLDLIRYLKIEKILNKTNKY